jgi:23S rRNA (cytosine1962-C5)-methyltransferase
MIPKAIVIAPAAKAIRRGYCWVFANQIQAWEGEAQPGDLVAVAAPGGELLGYAYANPRTTLSLRLLYSPAAGRRGPSGVPDERLEIGRKLDRAWSRRRDLDLDGDAVRLVWSEADGLPGIVCDRFADVLVVQFLTAGAEHRRAWVLEWLASHLQLRGIFERSVGVGRAREGLPPRIGWAWLPVGAPQLETSVAFREGPLSFQVDLAGGQKTGFYLDQRAARRLLQAQRLSGPVLDCFAYTGGLALSAAVAGARTVTAVDSSARALQILDANAHLNGLQDRIRPVRDKVFRFLEKAVAREDKYELLILDPPAFARNREQRPRALAGYRELHRRAAQLLQPDGWLLSCSCSHFITRRDLRASALAGVRDAGRTLKLRSEFGPDPDHPEKSQVPESRYLTCLFARVK